MFRCWGQFRHRFIESVEQHSGFASGLGRFHSPTAVFSAHDLAGLPSSLFNQEMLVRLPNARQGDTASYGFVAKSEIFRWSDSNNLRHLGTDQGGNCPEDSLDPYQVGPDYLRVEGAVLTSEGLVLGIGPDFVWGLADSMVSDGDGCLPRRR